MAARPRSRQPRRQPPLRRPRCARHRRSCAAPPVRLQPDDDLSAYLPARFKSADKLLSRQDRHLVSRFSYGVTPDLARDVRKAGGARAWFERQLRPSSIKDKKAGRLQAWWPSLKRGPKEACGSARSPASRAAGRS